MMWDIHVPTGTCCDVRHVQVCICCDVRHLPVLIVMWDMCIVMYLYLLWFETCTCICSHERHVCIFVVIIYITCACTCCGVRHVHTCICCDVRHVPAFVVMWDMYLYLMWCDTLVPVFVVMRGMYLYLLWWELPCLFAEWRQEGVRAVVGYCTPGVGLGGNVTNSSSRIHLPCQACGSLHCGARMQWQDWVVLVSVLVLLPVIDGQQGED